MSQTNSVLKTLGPLIKQRLADLESGRATPSASVNTAPWLNRLGVDATYGTSVTKSALPANYAVLPPSTQRLLQSVRNIQAQAPQPHHTSLLGHIWHDIEKPYQAVVGGLGQLEDFQKTPQGKGFSTSAFTGMWSQLAKGLEKGWEGKTKYGSASDVLAQDPIAKHQPHWVRGVEGFGLDVGLDPISHVSLAKLTKVKTLGHSAEAIGKAQQVTARLAADGATPEEQGKVMRSLLGGDTKVGRYVPTKSLPNAAMRADNMQHALAISKKYGDLTYTDLLAKNRLEAEKQLEAKGIKQYTGAKHGGYALTAFRKGLMPNATMEDLSRWNSGVRADIEALAGKLSGNRADWQLAKSKELLALATKSNLSGEAKVVNEQLQKALGVKFMGRNVAKIRIPAAVVRGTERAVASDKLKGIREFSDVVHGHFNDLFRTGAHIDPLVNSMRAARHSSIVDAMNNHIRNLNSIFGHVSKGDMQRVAEASARGLKNVDKIAGGYDHVAGEHVNDLVKYVTNDIKNIQRQVTTKEEFKAFNDSLPSYYRIPDKYFNKHPDDWLRKAWDRHFLMDPKTPGFNAVREHLGKNPSAFALIMKQAVFSAKADRELEQQYIQRFGHRLYHIDPATGAKIKGTYKDPIGRILEDKHGYRTPGYIPTRGAKPIHIPAYKGVVFPHEVASGIESVYKMMKGDASTRALGRSSSATRLFSDATSLFKTVVTKFNPGFHERNLMGEMSSSAADGVLTIGPYRKAMQVLRLHGIHDLETGQELGRVRGRVINGIDPNAFKKARIAEIPGDKAIIKRKFDFGEGIRREPTPDIVWHSFVESGLKTGWITTEMGKYGPGRFGSRMFGKVNDKVQHLTENIEDYTRLAHFISRIERSKAATWEMAVEEAAAKVRKFHFDYNDFTQFEKSVMSRIFPFYKWTRKNIPLQFALLFQNPRFLATQMHGLNAISNTLGFSNNGRQIPKAEEVMPQWLKDHLAVPVGMGSSGERYLDAPLPALQAFQFFGNSPLQTEQSAAYMLNPAIKIPLEIATQHQVGGAPIQTNQYATHQTPYTSLLQNLFNKNNTGKGTNLLQFLLGAGLVENTPARIKSELKQEQSIASAVRKKYRAKMHYQPLGTSN